MFENLLGQSAALTLAADVKKNALPPAVLFCGPEASGKASAALELARILSCRKNAEWVCDCPSCHTHKELNSKDLLVLGPRPFSAEICACAGAYKRDFETPSAKILFLRSVRKLLMRFSPVIWEGESEVSKFNTLLISINDALDDFCAVKFGTQNENEEDTSPQPMPEKLLKIVDSIVKDALKLESVGISAAIPVAHIRRASFWLRMAPEERRKTLIIENADRMKDEARNALLKTLEEPPPSSQIVLCSAKPRALLPTLLSRLRPYNFNSRSLETEAEIIRRVFRDAEAANLLCKTGAAAQTDNFAEQNTNAPAEDAGFAPAAVSRYLDGFLPVSKETLKALAAYFVMALASQAINARRKQGKEQSSLQNILVEMGKHSKEEAEKAGIDTNLRDLAAVCAVIMEKAEKFQTRRLYGDFVAALWEMPGRGAHHQLLELFRAKGASSVNAVTIFNQSSQSALEKLFLDLKEGICRL
ncbi:MAG: DNA polymerase III [Spirochaetaceae bacterium]|jgi:DNA polymerase-3 subunit gamma/tau|nr:DNA polymerase III [Spirochaetaceae bacterium]